MGILRTIGVMALVIGLLLGGGGSVLADGPPNGDPPDDGPPFDGPSFDTPRRGFFGNVTAATTITTGEEYVITLETKQGWTVNVTLTDMAKKYVVPPQSRGPVDLATFVDILDEGEDGDIEEIIGRRVAVLATNVTGVEPGPFTGDARRLMVIPAPDAPPVHGHRVGIVTEYITGTSITIENRAGEETIFDISILPRLLPAGTTEVAEGQFVTVIYHRDPATMTFIAKAIVVHPRVPEGWQTPLPPEGTPTP